ncbi:hypothetical protein ACLK2D_12620 [Escherichia coli]
MRNAVNLVIFGWRGVVPIFAGRSGTLWNLHLSFLQTAVMIGSGVCRGPGEYYAGNWGRVGVMD